MAEHLTVDQCGLLLSHRAHVSRAYGWILHLMGCQHCRRRLMVDHPDSGEAFLRRLFDTRDPLTLPELEKPETFDRVLAHVKTRGVDPYAEPDDLPPVFRRLQSETPARQRLLVDNVDRLRTIEVAEAVLEPVPGLWLEDPREARRQTCLALHILHSLSTRKYHPKLLYDLQGRAWGYLGNIERIFDRIERSRRALEKATALLRQGSDSNIEWLHLQYYWAGLAAEEFDFRRALDLVRDCLDNLPETEAADFGLDLRCRKIGLLADLGRIEDALAETDRLLGEDLNVMQRMMVRSNLAGDLRRAGQPLRSWQIAKTTLAEWPPGWLEVAGARALWQAARSAEACHHLEAALELLDSALAVFKEKDLYMEIVTVTSDLARVLLRQDRRPAALELLHTLPSTPTTPNEREIVHVKEELLAGRWAMASP